MTYVFKVDENMVRAQKRDAVRQGKFFFRKNVLPPGYISPAMSTPCSSGSCTPAEWQDGIPQKERKLRNCFPRVPPPSMLVDTPVEDEYDEMSMEEIFNGKVSVQCTCTVLWISRLSQGATFPGLLGLVEAYLETLDVDSSERRQINKYVDLVRRRANGPCLYFFSCYDPEVFQAHCSRRQGGCGTLFDHTHHTNSTRWLVRRSITTSWLRLTRCTYSHANGGPSEFLTACLQ